jgi:hypothetical protein
MRHYEKRNISTITKGKNDMIVIGDEGKKQRIYTNFPLFLTDGHLAS